MTDWPMESLISGTWRDLEEASVAKLEKVAREKNTDPLKGLTVVAARVMPLTFYEKGLLLEMLLCDDQSPYGIFRSILTKSYFVAIDGTSPPIHRLNAKRLKFQNELDRLNYLRLFCSSVRAEEGRFRIIETTPKIDNLDADLVVGPVKVKPRDEDNNTSVYSAHILYSKALFEAEFTVSDTGMVEMLDDVPVATDLAVELETFDRSGCIQLLDTKLPSS